MTRRAFEYRGESQTLNATTRSSLPGQFVELPDGFVHYELAGLSGGETVVLVPGISVPYFAWEPTFTALVAANLCVLRYDLYGRGYSDRPDVVYDLDLFDRQLEHLVAALGLTGMITPIGLSMGGAIAVTCRCDIADSSKQYSQRFALCPVGISPGPMSEWGNANCLFCCSGGSKIKRFRSTPTARCKPRYRMLSSMPLRRPGMCRIMNGPTWSIRC
jgi:pimeloyl-ACP methyl ester carboxylesterase